MHHKTKVILAAVAGFLLTAFTAAHAQDDLSTHEPRLEVDHLFVFVDGGGGRFELGTDARESLTMFPHLTWHEGQGTGGLYAYFNNFYIEFLALEVPEVAEANAANAGTDMNLRAAWRSNDGVSPFGIGLRDYASDPETLPFETFDYSAEWMGGQFTLAVAANAGQLNEPWTFTMPIAISGPPGPDLQRDGFAEYLENPLGIQNLTALELTISGDAPLSPTMQALQDEGLLTILRGEEPLARLTFDDGAQGLSQDWRPTLPIVIDY